MSGRHLGLFDTPPDRRDIRFGLAIVGLLFATFLLILPLRDVRLAEVNAIVPVVDATMLISDLIIGTLLYAQAVVFRSRALNILASGYVLGALFLVPHALTFPGAFAATGLLGAGVNTTGWLAVFWRSAFPISLIIYAWLKRADAAAQPEPERQSVRVLEGLLGAVVLATLLTLFTTVGRNLLPPLFLNISDPAPYSVKILHFLTMILTIVGIVMLFRQKYSVLDMWLLVSASGWTLQSLLILLLRARFTLGYYSMWGLMLATNLIVMFALVSEYGRLYGRLALSVSAMDREREARLTSVEAVAAAIAHEIGQPLTAVALNTKAGIGWLNREPPDAQMALQSLHAIKNAGRRTFDVIKSIRATVAKGSGELREFDVNDLVRETASLLDRDLAAHKISLQLALVESLPLVQANRVQMQRVIVNLLTNAIDSVAETRRRARRISIRSALLDGEDVLLEISDSGAGIAPERMSRIFEPLFTTKARGTGLGLPLSRTIVEDHGGRLWASTNRDHGATFHVQLPRRSALKP